MIIHCLTCGKCISSHGHSCPYCTAEVSDITLELNGIATEREATLATRMKNMVLGLVTK